MKKPNIGQGCKGKGTDGQGLCKESVTMGEALNIEMGTQLKITVHERREDHEQG